MRSVKINYIIEKDNETEVKVTVYDTQVVSKQITVWDTPPIVNGVKSSNDNAFQITKTVNQTIATKIAEKVFHLPNTIKGSLKDRASLLASIKSTTDTL